MAIYEITPDKLRKIQETSFSAEGVRERADLQRLLRSQIEIIAPDVLVIAEEFGEWEDSLRRIDLLGLDKEANLVVIELKRSEDGGHMELQALRYAAMVSTMTFEKAVETLARTLGEGDRAEEARSKILKFLDWGEPKEDEFAKDVRIMLVSAEFSKELTTTVMWLNERELDIRCIRMKPYQDNGRILIDVQQVIPLPEAHEYQVRLSTKNRQERIAREFGRDFTKYDVTINGKTESRLSKRKAIFLVIKQLCVAGVNPEEIARLLGCAPSQVFCWLDGSISPHDFVERMTAKRRKDGSEFDHRRWFCDDPILIGGKTYAVSNQWGGDIDEEANKLTREFPDKGIAIRKSENE